MSHRSEYFAIVAALCVEGEITNPAKLAEHAFEIWEWAHTTADANLLSYNEYNVLTEEPS